MEIWINSRSDIASRFYDARSPFIAKLYSREQNYNFAIPVFWRPGSSVPCDSIEMGRTGGWSGA